MKCPHCRVDFHDKAKFTFIGSDEDGHWGIRTVQCSACQRFSMFLNNGDAVVDPSNRVVGLSNLKSSRLVHPRGASRPPVPPEVPSAIAEDYTEACLVLADSAKASAALSRRCLQHLLRDAAGVKAGDLAGEIQQVLDQGKLPTQLAESIDAVRNIGNFSAHPIKSKDTGAIVPVEPQEAEWNLDVLEALFDYYHVQPAVLATKRAALDAKLAAAGKPPLKK